ncbi:MAG: hypothetical protein RIC14_00075 [Filomicrobium sp.]
MSFWGELTGSAAADRVEASAGRVRGLRDQGHQSQTQGIQSGRNAIQGGYGQGRNSLLSGRNAGNRAIQQGSNRYLQQSGNAIQNLRTGANQAAGTIRGGVSTANQHLQPYASSGNAAHQRYSDAIGLNGRDAQQGYVDEYMASPVQDLIQRNIARQYNARGMSDSGASRLAASRAYLEDYNSNLDRLRGLGDRGFQASGQMGANELAGAGQIAGYQDGAGRGVASVYQNRGNVLNNNAANIASNYANTGNALNTSYQGQAGLENQSFVNEGTAGLNYYDALAGDEVNFTNAINAAKAQGVNNIMSGLGTLGGSAISAFAPGAGGVSPAGNFLQYMQGGQLA